MKKECFGKLQKKIDNESGNIIIIKYFNVRVENENTEENNRNRKRNYKK